MAESFVNVWKRTVRRARLGRTVKAVAVILSDYADPDGTNVRPGLVRVAYEAEVSYNTAKAALATLRESGLIAKVGRYGDADVYRLILADDLLDRCTVPTPAEFELHLERERKLRKGNYRSKSAARFTGRSNTANDRLQPDSRAADQANAQACSPKHGPQNSSPAAHSTTPKTRSAVRFADNLRPVNRAATLHDPPLQTLHPGEDQDLKLAVPSQQTSGERQCAHGNQRRRCVPCRAAIKTATQSAAAARTARSLCPDHGLPAGVRPSDGQPNCTLCRVKARAPAPPIAIGHG